MSTLRRSHCGLDTVHLANEYYPVSRLTLPIVGQALNEISRLDTELLPGIEEPIPWTKEARMRGEGKWCKAVPVIAIDNLTPPIFEYLLSEHEPFRVAGITKGCGWTPTDFAESHGAEKCMLVDCASGAEIASTVGDFFHRFGKNDGGLITKLKV